MVFLYFIYLIIFIAIKIQSIWRMYKSKKVLKSLRNEVLKIYYIEIKINRKYKKDYKYWMYFFRRNL